MDIANLSAGVTVVINRLSAFERRLIEVEKAINESPPSPSSNHEEKQKLAEIFVEQVPLIGLKEAIIRPRRSIKCVWAFLFCLGTFGTGYYIITNVMEYIDNPNATVVKFIPQPENDFPALVLCPGTWLNSEKAFSMGLSMDALKYSLAYADFKSVDPTIDIDRGRKEFFDFYEAREYNRLIDYFNDISVDIEAQSSVASVSLSEESSFYCYRCENGTAPFEKVLIDGVICYVVELAPESTTRYLTWSVFSPGVIVKVKNQTLGLAKSVSNWKVYLMPDKYLVQPNFPPIYLKAFTVATLRFNTHKFNTIKSEESPCLEDHQVPPDYSSAVCAVNCLHKLYQETYGCHLLPYYSYEHKREGVNLSRYCNYLDKVDGQNITHFDLWSRSQKTTPMETKEAEICIHQCPHTCKRTIYISRLDSQYPIFLKDPSDNSYTFFHESRSFNLSQVVIVVENTATNLGGILTESEVVIMSITELLSNIGGTFNFFLGCTFLTIFQIVFFFLDYILSKREQAKEREHIEMRRFASVVSSD